MTENEKEVLTYIKQYTKDFGMGPNMKEIATYLHSTRQYAHQVVKSLRQQGFVEPFQNTRLKLTSSK